MPRRNFYPEHQRTDCSDAEPINAGSDGSGCWRCTAILLDQRDALLLAAERLLDEHPRLRKTDAGQALDAAIAMTPRA